MMVVNPIYGVLIAIVITFEVWFSMLLRKDKNPTPDPIYGLVRSILTIVLASWLVNTIAYNPIQKSEITSLIIIAVGLWIGIVSLMVIKSPLTELPILMGVIASIIASVFMGILGTVAGVITWLLLLVIAFIIKPEIPKLEDIISRQWTFINRYHLVELTSVLGILVLILRLQGFILF